jgi:hypothetical protein
MENTRQQQQLTHDEIARRAYQLWEQRGRPQGRDLELWLEAERQIVPASKPVREQVPASAQPANQVRSGATQTSIPPARQIKPAARAAARL